VNLRGILGEHFDHALPVLVFEGRDGAVKGVRHEQGLDFRNINGVSLQPIKQVIVPKAFGNFRCNG